MASLSLPFIAMIDAYRSLISQLAEHLGLDAEALLLSHELVVEDVTIGLLYDAPQDEVAGDLVLLAGLGQPDAHRRDPVHAELLKANSFWLGTGGGTLAVHPDSGEVLLLSRLPVATLAVPALVAALDVFIEVARFWRSFIDGSVPHTEATAQMVMGTV